MNETAKSANTNSVFCLIATSFTNLISQSITINVWKKWQCILRLDLNIEVEQESSESKLDSKCRRTHLLSSGVKGCGDLKSTRDRNLWSNITLIFPYSEIKIYCLFKSSNHHPITPQFSVPNLNHTLVAI